MSMFTAQVMVKDGRCGPGTVCALCVVCCMLCVVALPFAQPVRLQRSVRVTLAILLASVLTFVPAINHRYPLAPWAVVRMVPTLALLCCVLRGTECMSTSALRPTPYEVALRLCVCTISCRLLWPW